jgi:hypothetical protein
VTECVDMWNTVYLPVHDAEYRPEDNTATPVVNSDLRWSVGAPVCNAINDAVLYAVNSPVRTAMTDGATP